jgi:hypothetical protein
MTASDQVDLQPRTRCGFLGLHRDLLEFYQMPFLNLCADIFHRTIQILVKEGDARTLPEIPSI